MTKENVIDLLVYRETQEVDSPPSTHSSDDLITAIQHLIYRLRELGPLPQT